MIKRLVRGGCVFFLVISWFSPALAHGTDTLYLSLDQAVTLATDNHRSLRISRLEVRRATAGLREARGNRLPRLEASGQYNRNILQPVIFLPPGSPFGEVLRLGAKNTYGTTLSASLPLYAGAIMPGIRAARSGLDLAREADREARVNTISEVKRAYNSALLTQEAYEVMLATLNNARQNFEQVTQLYGQGQVSEFEQIRTEVQLQSVMPNVEQARDNYALALESLKLAIGLRGQYALFLTDSLVLVPPDEELQLTIDQNPGLRVLEQQRVVAEHQVAVAQGARHPSVAVFGNYQVQSQADDFDFRNYNWINTAVLGLQFSLPIFTGQINRQRVEQARVGMDLALEQQQQLRDVLRTQVQNQLFLMRQSFNRHQTQRHTVQLAQRAVDIARIRYASGLSTLLELNDAELSLTQTRLNYLQTVFDYNAAFIEYERLTGMAVEGRRVE
jgi:outer membrane protein